MNPRHSAANTLRLAALFLALGLILTACGPGDGSGPRLRVTNAGSVPIDNLVVMFPEEEVVVGNLPAGATSDFQAVSNGVYRYAAYRFDVNNQTITQPVIDWVGEEPIGDGDFTYVIDLDTTRPPIQMIQLQAVNREE